MKVIQREIEEVNSTNHGRRLSSVTKGSSCEPVRGERPIGHPQTCRQHRIRLMRSEQVCRVALTALCALSCDAVRILQSDRTRHLGDDDNSSWARRETVTVDVPSSPDGHLVKSLPLLQEGLFKTKHWAGHLPASNDGDKYLFYWLFAPDLTDSSLTEADVPLIIWLNGGPGCSSMDGLFIENGPFVLSKASGGDFQITLRNSSWHRAPAYTLYIDQPVGTGLSFTQKRNYASNDEKIATDFYLFLQSFFKLHSDKFVQTDAGVQKLNRRFYFSGESYAGHYIPSMINFILNKNANPEKDAVVTPVSGAAIGNGWMDPFHQYAGAEAAYGHGLIGLAEVAAFAEKEKECQSLLERGQYSPAICFDLIDEIVFQSQGSNSQYKISSYDVRAVESKNGARQFPPGHKELETFLGGWKLPVTSSVLTESLYTDVLEAIHATAASGAGQRYRECTDPPYNVLADKDGIGVVPDVISILEHEDNVEMLFFNGIEDLVCNHVGNEKFLENMQWKNRKEWIKSERYVWFSRFTTPGNVSGYMKEYNNLKFLKVVGAGHMVPLDVPEIAFDMIQLFTYRKSFLTSPQELDREESNSGSCPVCPACPSSTCPPCQATSCPSCPSITCPSCPPASLHSATDDDAGSELHSPEEASSRMPYALFAAAAAALASIGVIAFVSRRRRRSLGRTPVSQYDLELREGQYRDSFEDEEKDGANGDRTVI